MSEYHTEARFCVHRWECFCRPGMYLCNLSLALNVQWGDRAHVHAHCVVDDFGTLQPVAIDAFCVNGSGL